MVMRMEDVAASETELDEAVELTHEDDGLLHVVIPNVGKAST